jgi:hypothetical protein
MHRVVEALRGRSNRSKAGLLLGSALFVASAAGAWADAIEFLQGVWVDESSDCTKVFEKIQGKIQFKDRTYVQESGFIITGSKGKGPVGGTCTISQIDEENDRFSALLSCSDAVVSREFSFSFRIIDATHFERFDETVSPYRYKKCTF